MKKIKVQDIALAAGVSPATVTRVLRENGYVAEEKRHLVLQAARDLGYDFTKRPAKNGLPTVLLITPTSFQRQNWLFANITENICLEFQKISWFCLTYYTTRHDTDEIMKLLRTTRNINLKGIVFVCPSYFEKPGSASAIRRLLKTLAVPVILIERFSDITGMNGIRINAKESVYLAVKHLHKRGHRKILLLSPDHPLEVEQARIDGFQNAVAELGLKQDASYISVADYRPEFNYQALTSYAASKGWPTAIIAADPGMVGIQRCLYDHQLRVPEDISLVGIDDSIAGSLTPALTSSAFPVAEIARNTVQMIMEAELAESLPKTITLSTYLIERDSVAPPREHEILLNQ